MPRFFRRPLHARLLVVTVRVAVLVTGAGVLWGMAAVILASKLIPTVIYVWQYIAPARAAG